MPCLQSSVARAAALTSAARVMASPSGRPMTSSSSRLVRAIDSELPVSRTCAASSLAHGPQVLGGHHPVRQADLQGLAGIDELRIEQQLADVGAAQAQGQIGGHQRRHEADPHLAVEEFGIFGRHHEVVGRGEAATAGDAGAVDEGDRQRLLPQHGLEEVLETQRVAQVLLVPGVAQRAQVLQVRAGREILAGAGEQDGPHALPAPVAAVEIRDLADHGRREGVGALRIVEGDPEQVALPLDLDPFEGAHPAHRFASSSGTSISIRSRPWAWVLPWASFFRLSVPPPPSES